MENTRSRPTVHSSTDSEGLRRRILRTLAQYERDRNRPSAIEASDFDAKKPSLVDSALQDLAIGGLVRFAERDPAWGGNSVYRDLRITSAGRARLRA